MKIWINERKTNKNFLVLSFLGIIFIVAGHCKADFFGMDIVPYYNFHVPLFVFISGYFFNSHRKGWEWIKNKVGKLLVPYYVGNVVYGIICVFLYRNFGFHVVKKISAKSLLLDPLIPNALSDFNSAAWFVIILFYIEILHFLLAKLITYDKKKRCVLEGAFFTVVGTLAMLAAIEGIYIIDGEKNRIILTCLRTLTLAPFFDFGRCYKIWEESVYGQKASKYRVEVLTCILLLLIALYLIVPEYYGRTIIDYKQLSFGRPFIPYILGLAGIIFWLQISKMVSPCIGSSFVVNIIGGNTFAIMYHHLFGFFCCNFIIYKVQNYLFSDNAAAMYELFIMKPRNAIYSGGELYSWFYLLAGIIISLSIQMGINVTKLSIKKLKEYDDGNNGKTNGFTL